jgi:glycosyltransferase involved in cell wall biosynthesis
MVTFHGLLVGEAKWEVFRRATLLIHPTSWDGQPVTILEALAFGIPVVATRVGAIPDTVDHASTGYLMESRTAREALAGVLAITSDPGTYARYSKAAQAAYVHRYTREVFVENMRSLLEKTLKNT